jgi:hypothetical protein
MADLVIVSWRDIPAQVIVKVGRRAARRSLSQRFHAAIDRAAMRARKHDAQAYLTEWRRGEPLPCGDDLEAEAEAAMTRLETAYSDERLDALAKAGGLESG